MSVCACKSTHAARTVKKNASLAVTPRLLAKVTISRALCISNVVRASGLRSLKPKRGRLRYSSAVARIHALLRLAFHQYPRWPQSLQHLLSEGDSQSRTAAVTDSSGSG